MGLHPNGTPLSWLVETREGAPAHKAFVWQSLFFSFPVPTFAYAAFSNPPLASLRSSPQLPFKSITPQCSPASSPSTLSSRSSPAVRPSLSSQRRGLTNMFRISQCLCVPPRRRSRSPSRRPWSWPVADAVPMAAVNSLKLYVPSHHPIHLPF